MYPPSSKLGDIRPHNIFINDQGEVKAANLLSWPMELTNYAKGLENQVTYLAPEELKELEVGKLENENNERSETFSIGLTLLSVANLTDFSDLYDLKGYRFDGEKLQQNLGYFIRNPAYSDIMKAMVCNLCSINETRRV